MRKLYYVTNSESRGVEGNFTKGPISVSVTYGDGNDTGVFNYMTFLATYNFNKTDNLNLFGGVELSPPVPMPSAMAAPRSAPMV